MFDHLIALLIGYFILSLGCTLFYLRTTRSHLFRGISLFYLGASVATSLYLYSQLLSLPKPIAQEYFNRNAKEAVVLGVRAKDDQSIYLWLQLPNQDYPVYYTMPWSGQAAEELSIATKAAAQEGSVVLMKHPFQPNLRMGQRGDNKDVVFYAAPPPRPPLKLGEQESGAQAYRYPGR